MHRYFRFIREVVFLSSMTLGLISTGCGGIEPTIRQQVPTPEHPGIPPMTAEHLRVCVKEYGRQLEGGSWAFSPAIQVQYAGYVLEFCLTSLWVPIAIRTLAEVIQSIVESDVQCLPLTISGQSGMVVLNALRYIRCVNEQHSEFIKWTKYDHRADLAGKFRQVTKLVLDSRAIPADAHFFRIKDWEIVLVVSETVKNAMEKVGCVGAEFVELELA